MLEGAPGDVLDAASKLSTKMSIARELRTQKEKIDLIRASEQAVDDPDARIAVKLRRAIQDEVLVNSCPRCSTVFLDFEGSPPFRKNKFLFIFSG